MAKATAVISKKDNDHRKNLVRMIEKSAYKYGRHSLWNDFVYMCAASFSQIMNYRQNRENEYMRRINAYDKETQKLFPEMCGELTLAFENERFADILGEIYSKMNLTDSRNGQFFTPYHVCKFMAAVNGTAESLSAEIEKKGYISVNDSCCGAGAMLIAFADHCMDCGINYQQSVLFVAQDIDPAAALMCYTQMTLLGMSGYVIIGNSLIPSEDYDVWYTPMYFLQGFNYRTQKNDTVIETEPQTDDTVPQPAPQAVVIPTTDIDAALRETDSGQFEFDFAV